MSEELFIVGSEPTFGTWNMAAPSTSGSFLLSLHLLFFKIEDEGGCMIHYLIELQGKMCFVFPYDGMT